MPDTEVTESHSLTDFSDIVRNTRNLPTDSLVIIGKNNEIAGTVPLPQQPVEVRTDQAAPLPEGFVEQGSLALPSQTDHLIAPPPETETNLQRSAHGLLLPDAPGSVHLPEAAREAVGPSGLTLIRHELERVASASQIEHVLETKKEADEKDQLREEEEKRVKQ